MPVLSRRDRITAGNSQMGRGRRHSYKPRSRRPITTGVRPDLLLIQRQETSTTSMKKESVVNIPSRREDEHQGRHMTSSVSMNN
jgi:hypothetical protein